MSVQLLTWHTLLQTAVQHDTEEEGGIMQAGMHDSEEKEDIIQSTMISSCMFFLCLLCKNTIHYAYLLKIE